jgi:hypothetical protein
MLALGDGSLIVFFSYARLQFVCFIYKKEIRNGQKTFFRPVYILHWIEIVNK